MSNSNSVKIQLRLKNRELLNSLLYQLGIKFRPYSFSLTESAVELVHDCEDTQTQALIVQHVTSFEDANLRLGNRVLSKSLWASEGIAPLQETTPPESSLEQHPGLWTHFDEVAEISRSLSQAFEELAKTYGAKDISLPRLISKNSLLRMGHLPKEAHQIAFLTVPGQEEQEYALTPAVCLPCYAALENRAALNQPLTLEGLAHRYEGGVFSKNSMSRLREFKVREIISFGAEKEQQRLQEFFIKVCQTFSAIFDMPTVISTATDLFFHAEGASQAFHQLVHQSKIEFKIQFENMEMAVGSYNNHGDHFTKVFNIGDATALRSFCVGFGIDRLAYAVYCKGFSINEINERVFRLKEAF